MPITSANPFKGRQYPGDVILLCVRWYLRYPLAYEHVAELLNELVSEASSEEQRVARYRLAWHSAIVSSGGSSMQQSPRQQLRHSEVPQVNEDHSQNA